MKDVFTVKVSSALLRVYLETALPAQNMIIHRLLVTYLAAGRKENRSKRWRGWRGKQAQESRAGDFHI